MTSMEIEIKQWIIPGCWCLVLLLSLPSTIINASPLSIREREDAAVPNVELKLKNCSFELDKVRRAARRYLTALGSSLNEDSSSSSLSAAQNRPSFISSARPLTVTNTRNKTSSSFERVNENSHRKYLSSLNDSGWITQCLNGEKCVNRTPTEVTSRKNQDPQRTTLKNLRVFSNSNQDAPKLGEVGVETISPFTVTNHNVSGTNSRSTAAQYKPHGMNITVETASKGYNILLQKVTGEKGLHKSPIGLITSKNPNEEDNQVALPLPMEDGLKGEVLTDVSEDEKSTSRLKGFKKGSLNPEIDATSELTRTPKAQILPQNMTGDKGLPMMPVSTEELKNDFEQQNSLTHSWINPEISAANVEKTSQESTDGESLPISIHLKPVIHNHYYNRRQTKSAEEPKESPMSDFDIRPLESIVEKNAGANGTKKAETEGITEFPRSGGRCDDPKTPGCENLGTVENLIAAGDLTKRLSTGKRQSDGNAIDSADSESAMKTEVQNTKYPEEQGSLFPKNKNGNSNIFLIMGGQWLVNVKDHPEILCNMKPKSSVPLRNMVGLYSPPPSINYGSLPWPYSKQVSSSEYPTSGILSSYHVVRNTQFPCYSNRNGILASRSSKKVSTRDNNNFLSRDYSQGELPVGSYYYPINPRTIFPLPEKPRLDYPESLVNFPLGDIKQNQGANMIFKPSSVKPEEHLLHDMDPVDYAVVGAQMFSILEPPRPNLPDPEYPLQPVAINDMNSPVVGFPSARDSSLYPNQPLAMHSYNYHQLQQVPSIHNTSHSSEGQQVHFPPKILINERNPSIRHPGFDEYDFVSGQYVKTYRSDGGAYEGGYYGRTPGNSPGGSAGGCQEPSQRYSRTPEDTYHHYRHSWDYLPWSSYVLDRVHDHYPTERNSPSDGNENPSANGT